MRFAIIYARHYNTNVNGKIYSKIRIQFTQKSEPILQEIKDLLKRNYQIQSNIQRKWNQDAFILRITARNSIDEFEKRIGFKNHKKRNRLSELMNQIPKKQPRKLKI